MLSRNLEQTLHRALGLAKDVGTNTPPSNTCSSPSATTPTPPPCCVPAASDAEKLKRDLAEFLDKDLAGLVSDRAGDAKPTAGFQRVVQRAAIHVQSSGRDEVTGANVLVACSASARATPSTSCSCRT
jgi:ATP-dependent Clp protease ATP-binding subunit ClpA